MGLVTWGSNGSSRGQTDGSGLSAAGRGVVDGTLMMPKRTRSPTPSSPTGTLPPGHSPVIKDLARGSALRPT
ncbi:hypothetical protein GCM10027186_24230 [Micromonospora schwarzwaldensis]